METTRPDNRVELAGLDVLVVDDDPDALDLLATLLETRSARVVCASSAGEAFHRMVERNPDVLISDIGMPGEDGYSLIHRVRGLPEREGGDTPAIALTAFNQESDRSRALAAGFSLHLAKPIDVSRLCSEVSRLGRSGAHGSAVEQLRDATAGLQQRLAHSPYAQRVLEGRLTVAEYGAFLQAMYLLHRELETAIARVTDAHVRGVYRDDKRQSTLLADDLQELGLALEASVPSATLSALANGFHDAYANDPYYLLGAAFGLESMSLSGAAQRDELVHHEAMSALRHRYLSGYDLDRACQFELFAARVNRALREEAARERALAGARATFDGISHMLHDVCSDARAASDESGAYRYLRDSEITAASVPSRGCR